MPEIAGLLKDRTEVTYLAGVKDLDFEQPLDVGIAGRDLRRAVFGVDDSPVVETRMSTVAEPNTNLRLAPTLESVLAQLRRSIRTYVWVEAVVLLVIVLGLSFWFSLLFDWLFEPPAPLRVALLVAAALRAGLGADSLYLAAGLRAAFRSQHGRAPGTAVRPVSG